MHQFSLINANTDFVVLSAAHLYRALQAHGFLEVPRDDLNFILTQQEKETTVTDGIPKYVDALAVHERTCRYCVILQK